MGIYDMGCDPYKSRRSSSSQDCISDERTVLFSNLRKHLPAKNDVILFYEEFTVLEIKFFSVVCIPTGGKEIWSLLVSDKDPHKTHFVGRFGSWGELSNESIRKAEVLLK